MKQSTINKEIEITGVGLFSGDKVNLKLRPSHIDTGIVFSIRDNHISATYDNIIKTDRRTVIGNDSIQIHTIEHLMAALYMKNITNIIPVAQCESVLPPNNLGIKASEPYNGKTSENASPHRYVKY